MSMVERVARAIDEACVAWQLAHKHLPVKRWDVPGEFMARAAIEAMQEPTIRMASEGLKEWECATDAGDFDTDAHDMELIWRSMVSAALGEGE